MTGPYLDTAAACAYLKRCREWLRQHRAEIGYSRPNGGHPRYRLEDLNRYMEKWQVSPPAEIGTARHRPGRSVSSAGGINSFTGMAVGAYTAAAERRRGRR